MAKGASRPQPTDPITRADLDEVIDTINNAFKHVATKQDLEAFATREELYEMFVTKQELYEKFATKDELKKSVEELKHHFDTVAEKIHQDVASANKDEISALDTRVTRVENHLSLN